MNPLSVKWSGNLVVLCNHQRPDGALKPSCGHHGSEELRGWLKQELQKDGVWGRVRVVTGSCLAVCPKAGVVVSLPQQDGSQRVFLVDPEKDREELLAELKSLVAPKSKSV